MKNQSSAGGKIILKKAIDKDVYHLGDGHISLFMRWHKFEVFII